MLIFATILQFYIGIGLILSILVMGGYAISSEVKQAITKKMGEPDPIFLILMCIVLIVVWPLILYEAIKKIKAK